ncbi:MAG: ATP-binding protein [Pseudomonadota bacterium]
MHPLLARQLRKFCLDGQVSDLAGLTAAVDNAYVSFDGDRAVIEHALETMSSELGRRNRQLAEQLAEKQRVMDQLLELNRKLEAAQNQLLQAEKMATVGQLAAGVAHEINNPIGYIFSNFSALQSYMDQMFALLANYEQAEAAITLPAVAIRLRAHREEIDLDFLRRDIPLLMSESKEGITRVRDIVQDLKDFSHVDAHQDWVLANLHRGIDSTLNIVANEVKYKADVVREYGDMPEVECLPSQINQVVMNLVVNAAHAIGDTRGTITVRTGTDGADAWISVSDTGCGIAPENLARIFEPFFTTKPVGKGTGLGLSLAYGIVQKHDGRIEVDSEPGRGTTVRVIVPIRRPAVD